MLTVERMEEIFETSTMEFEDIPVLLHPSSDLHALLLLDKLAGPKELRDKYNTHGDMIVAAAHDQIWLDGVLEVVAQNATEENIHQLSACGVFIDDENESFSMFK